jgi:hypothetical protein
MPTQGCGDDGKSACAPTQQEADQNAAKLVLLQAKAEDHECKAGNEIYCPSVKKHPAEVAGFVVAGLVGGPIVENFALEGGLASTAQVAWDTVLYPKLVAIITYFATHNRDSEIVSIGSNPYYKMEGYTYFSIWDPILTTLNKLGGLGNAANDQFVYNQAAQVKDFAVTIVGEIGAGTEVEIKLLETLGYAEKTVEGFSRYFSKP